MRIVKTEKRHKNLFIAALAIGAISACTNGAPPNVKSFAARGRHPASPNGSATSIADDSIGATAYDGVDSRGIPHYAVAATLSSEDARVLRVAYGIEDPHRLYVSDSTEEGILKYDTQLKRCAACYVNSYRVGYVSVRRPGESWEQAERRVRKTPARTFIGPSPSESNSVDDLDPDVRPLVTRMLAAAQAAGFHFRIGATYRSPLREAFLMARGRGQTHTLTSNHSYGRALDIFVGDGQVSHPRTRRDWISFRRWVTHYRTPTGESFRVLGKPESTWDWPHVELPSSQIGFSTIEEAVKRGRACLAPGSKTRCNFQPHLAASTRHVLVQ